MCCINAALKLVYGEICLLHSLQRMIITQAVDMWSLLVQFIYLSSCENTKSLWLGHRGTSQGLMHLESVLEFDHNQ